ncbi:hypothetical protein CYMTET_37511, partial [Cymbomonas tetramitiformis]
MVDASKMEFGASWDQYVQQIAVKAATELGLDAATLGIRARLYKLVLYEEGGRSALHRGTEKSMGMFGTLVVHLPAQYEGGALKVHHKGQTKLIDLSQSSEECFGYSAFFAECEHELQPVTSGHRLTLLYNLIRTTYGPAPAPTNSSVKDALLEAAEYWERDRISWIPECPQKLFIPLEHKCTEADLSFLGLTGRDRAMADVLRSIGRDGSQLLE